MAIIEISELDIKQKSCLIQGDQIRLLVNHRAKRVKI